MELLDIPLVLLSMTPQRLVAVVLGAVRAGGAMVFLPIVSQLPWRVRISVAGVVGGSLASLASPTTAELSIVAMISELAIGVSFGLGFRLTLSALQSAGTWIDEQTATGLASEPFLAEVDDHTSGTASLLAWIGAWLLLTSHPIGVELSMLQSLSQSWSTLPVGRIISPLEIPAWSTTVLRSWSELALGVALPVCLLAGMIQSGFVVIGRGLGVNLGAVMSPARGGLSCLLLYVVLPAQADRIHEFQVSKTHQLTWLNPVKMRTDSTQVFDSEQESAR